MAVSMKWTRVLGLIALMGSLGCGMGGEVESDDHLSEGVSLLGKGYRQRYEAEAFTNQNGCSVGTGVAGYTGSGFADYGGNGTWIEWNNIQAVEAGRYTLTFRYANGSPSGLSRQSAILVNGQNVGQVPFAHTGAWTTWKTAAIKVSLQKGVNTIRVMANTSSGGPNLDNMQVEVDDICLSDPNKAVPGFCGCGTPEGRCSSRQYEAEDRTAAYDCSETTAIAGYTGRGFMNYGGSGSWVEWNNISASTGASYSLSFRYANGGAARQSSVFVNGLNVGNGQFANTGGWAVWKTDGIAVSLRKGNNTIRVVANTTNGGPNLDNMVISGQKQTLKVFILAGQSNMVGQGTVNPTQAHLDKNGGKGTLKVLVTNASTKPQYAHLVNSNGSWASRSDVWLVDLDSSGPLTITKETFGPELQFGHVIGNYYQEPVLIIKTAWGGKSLYVDFRPPSSGGTVGPYYTAMVDRVHQVLSDIRQYDPSYGEQGYEIVGFGWHQGWNDRINSAAVAEYQKNCVNLINDLRTEFSAPKMRFVLATTGMGGWAETNTRALGLMNAQLAVPNDSRLKNGYVSAVETRDFWRDQAISPADQGYHWNRNAETYYLIGNGMGQAMINLIKTP